MKQEAFTDQKALIERLKQGDKQAWNQVYTGHFKMIAGLVGKNSGSEEDIHDVYHYTLMQVHRKAKAGQLDGLNCKLSTFIYSIARNRWLYRLREERKVGKVFLDTIDLADEDTSVAENEYSLRRKAWEQAKSVLSEKCRGILQAFYLQKQSMADIAQQFGLQDARSAKVQKNKCMEKIRPAAREQLKRLGG